MSVRGSTPRENPEPRSRVKPREAPHSNRAALPALTAWHSCERLRGAGGARRPMEEPLGIAVQADGDKKVVIVDGVRTPFAKSGGPLKDVSAAELGRLAVSELLARTEVDPAQLDEVVLGNCGTPADAANIGRVGALAAGIPRPVPAFTVHRNCASGMEAVAQAYYKISAGAASAIVAGGTESMSEYPLLWSLGMTRAFAALERAKSPPAKLAALLSVRPRDFTPRIAIAEGLTDPVCGLNMGDTAERLAKEFRISREAQDEFALLSHQRAVAATDAGRL